MTNTANGQAIVTKVQLDNVRIGDVTLHGVDALVHQVELPVALLGMISSIAWKCSAMAVR